MNAFSMAAAALPTIEKFSFIQNGISPPKSAAEVIISEITNRDRALNAADIFRARMAAALSPTTRLSEAMKIVNPMLGRL
jgi:hypothetical protein